MGWNKFSGTPVGYGVSGGAARLSAGGRSKLVKVETEGPNTWALVFQADKECTFTVLAGCGQATQEFSYTVAGGRSYATIVAETVEVDALAGIAAASVYAAASPNNGPNGSPSDCTATAITLTASVERKFTETGRLTLLVHNNTAGVLQVRLAGVDVWRVAAQSTLTVDYGGAFSLFSTVGGSVSVAELFA